MAKIDEILAWEQGKDRERDTKFVELGRYLCEVRAEQYWRVENHENLPPEARNQLKEVGWTKGWS